MKVLWRRSPQEKLVGFVLHSMLTLAIPSGILSEVDVWLRLGKEWEWRGMPCLILLAMTTDHDELVFISWGVTHVF